MGSAEKRNYVEIEGLAVAPELVEFLAKEAAPGTGVEPEKFWKGFATIIRDLAPKNRALLAKRDELQARIDAWYKENRRQWLENRNRDGFPVLVAEREGQVVGYASYGPFRPFEGFRHSSELSVYVASNARGGGIGRTLLAELIEEARERKVHVLIAGIEAGNAASIALHRSQGFEECGTLKQVGQKFGRWLDLLFMQKIL
ncbi:malate synthase G [Brucella ovis IntaBari-2006-46-332]|uniref:GNAT family N-acetyltransferase n=1 Tax=Brucella ovis TaxID=236 RepID=UPI0002CE946F|nr:GNAT family N-acetyltransferase [Brucella ovis]ENT77685.1 malate synthase G [Brucella ovis IntaBari-2009-88-4]ENT80169.1 malate synthase G [Brucella ovis IntaBari-2006-46-348]ENT83230.1 malate synthase G [Brucella ovis IntaBari-2010-47-268]ENT87764.1 malate synthase G [Brucella ovis IntaBari-2006-46-332]ENT88695.1 malate synthase G [Brucella ovis IntaBari-2010-47-871]